MTGLQIFKKDFMNEKEVFVIIEKADAYMQDICMRNYQVFSWNANLESANS